MSGLDGTAGGPPHRSFSARHGFAVARVARDEVPIAFRHSVAGALKQAIIFSDTVIAIVQRCAAVPRPLGVLADQVIMPMIEACEWWRVFDIAEAGWREAGAQPLGAARAAGLERAVNDACIANGLAWRMERGEFLFLTNDEEEGRRDASLVVLTAAGARTASDELALASGALSRRPTADTTGAVQHAGAALETFARQLTGEPSLVFGQILSRNPDLVSKEYSAVARTAWGAISENGRHLHADRAPSLADAGLLVGLTSVLIAYMGRPRAAVVAGTTVP